MNDLDKLLWIAYNIVMKKKSELDELFDKCEETMTGLEKEIFTLIRPVGVIFDYKKKENLTK